MKKIIKTIDEKNGILQITTVDERFYAKPSLNQTTGLPEYQFIPSVSWICSYFPKGIAFFKWLAEKGWDESESIKMEAGEKGSKVHKATEEIDKGEKVSIDSKFINPTTEQLEELSFEEYHCLWTYTKWLEETKPTLLATEFNIFTPLYGGTIDRLFVIDGEVWLVDLKTGQNIFPSHVLQISAYKHGLEFNEEIMKKLKELGKTIDDIKLATLQLGYRKNKNGYKFTEQDDKYNIFLSVYELWKDENFGKSPAQKDYPLFLEYNHKKEEIKVAEVPSKKKPKV